MEKLMQRNKYFIGRSRAKSGNLIPKYIDMNSYYKSELQFLPNTFIYMHVFRTKNK